MADTSRDIEFYRLTNLRDGIEDDIADCLKNLSDYTYDLAEVLSRIQDIQKGE